MKIAAWGRQEVDVAYAGIRGQSNTEPGLTEYNLLGL